MITTAVVALFFLIISISVAALLEPRSEDGTEVVSKGKEDRSGALGGYFGCPIRSASRDRLESQSLDPSALIR
jgi:hypothetical protein